MIDLLPLPEDAAGDSLDPDSLMLPGETIVAAEARLLTPEEIQSIVPVFAEYGAPMPDPATSFIVGEVVREEVVSFLVVQLKVHAQPLWIKPGHEASFRKIARVAERTCMERTGGGFEVYVFAEPGKIAKMAESLGMKKEPWGVYSRFLPKVEPEPQEPMPTEAGSEVIQ